jgi:hypothetical protein
MYSNFQQHLYCCLVVYSSSQYRVVVCLLVNEWPQNSHYWHKYKTKPKMTVPRKVYVYKKKSIWMESTNTLIKRISMFLPIIQKQTAFKNVGENLKKYYHRHSYWLFFVNIYLSWYCHLWFGFIFMSVMTILWSLIPSSTDICSMIEGFVVSTNTGKNLNK